MKFHYCKKDKCFTNQAFNMVFCCCGNYMRAIVERNNNIELNVNIKCDHTDCVENWILRVSYNDGYYEDYYRDDDGYGDMFYGDPYDDEYDYIPPHGGIKDTQQLFRKTNKEIVKCKLNM
jgi:hypothetical protein